MPKAKNQKQGSASLTEMDARTLLRLINTGALAQHKIFDDKIKHLGQEHGLNYQLVALNQNSLVFENADTGVRYKADIHRLDKGRFKFDNIQELRIVDTQKKGSFEKACTDLVEAISEDNQKDADSVFHRIARQRFRPGVIPESGFVTTRDGISRYVHVHEDTVPEEAKPFIIKKICESLKDHVVVYNGQIVEATFSDGGEDNKLRIPITELMRRKVLCRHMKESAKKAYKSEGFQNRIGAAASNYNNGKAMEAAKLLVPFVKENQEFSVLTLEETSELVSNSLAATGCFSENTGAVIGKMLYKSSCQVNRAEIIESWKKAAQKAESAALLQNTRILDERKDDFEDAYSEFLQMVFAEDSSTKSVRAQSYLNSLKEIRKVVEGTDEEGILSALDDFIVKLEMDPEQIDDASLYEIEDLLASISQELIQDVRSLSDYDEIPESPEMDPSPTFGDKDLSGEPGAGGPAVPLPLGGGMDDLGIDAAGGDVGDEEELELSPELGGAEPSGEALPLAADINKDASPISEHSVIGDKNISEMDEDELKKELVEWTKNSAKFFSESGFDTCSNHIDNYVDRAISLKSDELVENFQKILADVLLSEQGESDPYAFVTDDICVEGKSTCSECSGSMTKAECEAGSKCSKCSGTKSEATGDYGGTGTEMGGQDGKGVADKSAKKSDGKTSDKTAGKGGTAKESFESKLDAAVHEATGEYSGTGLEMGGQDGKGVAAAGLKKVSGTDGSSSPGGSSNTDSMDDQGGEGVAGSSASKSDGKSSGKSAGSSSGRDDSDKSAGKGSAKTPTKYDGTGTEMGGQDGKGVAKTDSSESDGISSDKSAGKGGTVGEDVEIDEAADCGCKVGGCKNSESCDCPDSCPCKGGKVDEDQFKNPTKRRRMNPSRASLMQTEDKDIDAAISAIASTIASDDDIAEGGLPPGLEKYKKKKKGEKGDDDSDDGDDEGGDDDDGDSDGGGNKGGETGGNPFANEDKDITTPGKSGYDTEADSRKDGDGKNRRSLPKFSDSDYDGSSGAKTADQSGDSGLSS